MATLGKIRNRSGLLLAVIGFAMLAFILTDFMNSLGSGNRGSVYVGEIFGKDILYTDYEKKVEEGINNWKSQNQQGILSQAVIGQIREQMWDQYVREKVMDNEYENLGITVSDDEFFELLQGLNVHPQISQVPAFQDPSTGQFDRTKVIAYLKQIDQDQTGEARSRWLAFQEYLIGLIKKSKYNTLINNSMYVTSQEAQNNYNEKLQTCVFDYVAIPFSSINDSLVKPTKKQIKTYYNDNRENYKQDESNDVDFVVFSVLPSADDDEMTRLSLQELKSDFNLYEDYELMVKRNSDNRSATFRYTTKENLQDTKHKELFAEKEGLVIGPYLASTGVYRLSKLVSVQYRPDSVSARHILLKPSETLSIDSIYVRLEEFKSQIKKGFDFGDLAQLYSEDKSTAIKGGDLGWFQEGVMVDSFNEACFTSKKGELKIVESQFGVHLIEVNILSKPIRKVKIASIDRFVEPSTETFNMYYTQAAQFAGKILNEKIPFDTLVNKQNLLKRSDKKVSVNKQAIIGIPNSRELVKWLNKSDVGNISEVFQFDNMYVVAFLTKKHQEGYIPLSEIKEEITSLVIKENKLNYINSTTKEQDLDGIAKSNNQVIVRGAVANMNDMTIQKVGYEPKLVGSVFGLKSSILSPPIKGKNAVFYFNVVSKDKNVSTNNTSQIKRDIKQADFANAQGAVYNVLKDNANVKDNRSEFY